MFNALKEVLLKSLTSVGTQLHEPSKWQMEQVNKLTEVFPQLTSSHNSKKLVSRITSDSKNSDNSNSGEDVEKNDRRNWVNIHGMDRSFYNETGLASN